MSWLLDLVPPDYRLHGVLLRYPPALAVLAKHHATACVEGARHGYRGARSELGDQLPPGGIESVLAVYRSEGARLAAAARAVELVERALRGEAFVPELGGTQDASRRVTGARGSRPAKQPAPRKR